ncbi:unnamed protein product, partial [Rotaria magnacalcarata]
MRYTLPQTPPTIILILTSTGKPSVQYFASPNCSNPNYIGTFCNISKISCDVHKPCQSPKICINDPTVPGGYYCQLENNFTDTNNGVNSGSCKSNSCLYNGICVSLNNTRFYCNCTPERTGHRCEHLINYCHNVTCLNKGVCRTLNLDYQCECPSGSYSGRHCEYSSR